MRKSTGGTCIYPGPHGVMSAEHYLPAGLGTFRGCEPLQERLCRRCNREIGSRVEEQFLRAGPTGFFRWMLGIEGRNGLPPSPFYRRAAGTSPIIMLRRAPGLSYDLLWEVSPGSEKVFPLRQIVFDHPLAGTHPIPVLDRMRDKPDALRDCLRERGLENARPVHAFAGPDEIPWVSELLPAVGGVPPGDWVTTSFPPQRIPLVATVTVTEAYFRAIAKIAFHYTLKMFPELTGKEPEFAGIKEFIWAGGDADRFVRQRPDQFVVNFQRGYRPTHWSHILGVERAYNAIVAYAQFFAGPHCLPPPYEVQIGINPARVIQRIEPHAHQFVITNPTAAGGLVGEMVDLQPVNHLWLPWVRNR